MGERAGAAGLTPSARRRVPFSPPHGRSFERVAAVLRDVFPGSTLDWEGSFLRGPDAEQEMADWNRVADRYERAVRAGGWRTMARPGALLGFILSTPDLGAGTGAGPAARQDSGDAHAGDLDRMMTAATGRA